MNIKNVLGDLKSKPDALPEGLTPKGIESAVKEAGRGSTKALKAIIDGVAFGGTIAWTALSKGVSLTGIGLTFGLRQVLHSVVDAAAENPEARIKIADMLSQSYKTATSLADKTQIIKAIESLGLRANKYLFTGQ